MDIVLHSLNGVLTVLIMIAMGVLLERKGWFDEKSVSLVSKLVTQVCLPTYMLTNILGKFQHDQLISMSKGLIVPFISMMAGYFISKLIAKLIGVPRSRAGIFTACVSFSNTIFIGLPLGIALFGDEGAPYIMIYYMVNTTLFWTLGVYELASGSGEAVALFSRQTLHNILSLPLLGFMAGVAMVILEWQLPQPVFKAFSYIGGMTTPLAMLFIGIAMSKDSDKSQLKLVVYDIFPLSEFWTGKSNLSYFDRKRIYLKQFENNLKYNPTENLEIVPIVYEGTDHSEIWKWLDYAEAHDWEGCMINLDTPYECKRVKTLIKVKKFFDISLSVIDIEEGTGRNKGKLGAIVCKYYDNIVNVGSGFTDSQRIYYWQNKDKMLDHIVDVKYKEITTDKKNNLKSLQFPIYLGIRFDKSIPDDEI